VFKYRKASPRQSEAVAARWDPKRDRKKRGILRNKRDFDQAGGFFINRIERLAERKFLLIGEEKLRKISITLGQNCYKR